ncbi:MAG: hypothetical protein H0X59_00455 [Chloroflexi bacterium]|nr:hypothetical protein [Chloroflexota bacterium]
MPEPTATGVTLSGASIEFQGVGFDGPAADAIRERIFTFVSRSAGIVEASAEASGSDSIRLCLGRGAPGSVTAQRCRESAEATVTSAASGAETPWTVTLIGAEGAGGTANLVLSFPSDEPSVTVDGFRFQGLAFGDFNGFVADVQATGAGNLGVAATWSGGSVPYRLTFADDDAVIEEETGEGMAVSTTVAVSSAGAYRIALGNQQEFAEQDLTLRATISWP